MCAGIDVSARTVTVCALPDPRPADDALVVEPTHEPAHDRRVFSDVALNRVDRPMIELDPLDDPHVALPGQSARAEHHIARSRRRPVSRRVLGSHRVRPRQDRLPAPPGAVDRRASEGACVETIAVIVCTDLRGVFFGYVDPVALDAPDWRRRITLDRARICVCWSEAMHGICGLAARGPDARCRISPAVPRVTLVDLHAVLIPTDAAIAAWEAEPWAADE